MYDLKQVPKKWHEKFDSVLIANGYLLNDADRCVYSKFSNNSGVIICLYVDDMLIMGTNISVVKSTKKFLTSKFDMKDMGEADIILGIKISKTSDELALSQSHYVKKLLKKFGYSDKDPMKTPYDPSIHL